MAVSKDYQNGYDAAIEAIKQHLENMKNNSNSSNSGDGKELDDDMMSPAEATGQGGSSGDKQSGGSGDGQKSRTSKGDENQGVVRPEDCAGSLSSSLSGTPGTAGGMISSDVGEKLAKAEGYDPETGSDSAIEKDWADTAIKEASKHKGNLPGSLVSTINALYKVTTDWKKTLKKIIGLSISPDDKRQAYANKNVLVTQDRVARTDKDKYDNLDYMMVWVDSSGSMSDDQLRQCLSEAYAIALAKKPLKLVVVQCDTKIQEITEYKDLKSLKNYISKATVKGRGGTELKPCWDLLKDDPRYKRKAPELIMVFTDGYLTQYKRNPRTMRHLCWVILDNSGFELQHKDALTKVIHINTADIK